MLKSKGKIQVGIYLISILMMGVVGIASAISVIGANFPELSQTDVQTLISIPCIIIIPVTLIVGKLMQVMSKKLLAIIGIILFLIGGLVPAFMTSFLALQILRGVFGVGVGILQVVSTALVAENFEGAERDRVQGNLQAFQMLGCAIMVFVGGWLATMGWNTVFYVHIIGAISLIVALVCLPNVKPSAPAKAANSAPAEKGKLTGKMWVWMIIAFFVFCTGQLYSNGNAYLLTEKGIGDSAASGLGMAFFCAGGIIMGLLYGKLASALKDYTMGVGFIVMALSYAVMAMARHVCRNARRVPERRQLRRPRRGRHGPVHCHLRAELRPVLQPLSVQPDSPGCQRGERARERCLLLCRRRHRRPARRDNAHQGCGQR